MAYRAPADVREEFSAHPRRALIITTVKAESLSVKAHLANPEFVIGEKGGLYELGRFADPAGEWLIVHAITPQGNSDAGLVAGKAYQEFGVFHAQLFVGVAGSLKDDIPIGSVVVGDYVYNGHSAKVEDSVTLGRPHGMPAARELLTASQALIYTEEWRDLIRAPYGMQLPVKVDYPCDFPPLATIKGIVSGEEVVAGGKSPRYDWLRSHFNDCGAVEMEGWGAMNAAHYENGSAIVVRGISDMCSGKDYTKDQLHQPIAAAHAAAFAFSILSFRSKVPNSEAPSAARRSETSSPEQACPPPTAAEPDERRVEFVLNFEGTFADWTNEKVDTIIGRLQQVVDDEKLTLIRVDPGSVRLVLNIRESDLPAFELSKLRELASEAGTTLLGATTMEAAAEAETAKSALAAASANLLSWEKTLPTGTWMERPERGEIERRFLSEGSSTVLLGLPGSGKSALLSMVASDLLHEGATIFGLKADLLSTEIATEADLQRDLGLPALPSDLVLRMAALQPVFVFIDQLDALASQLDLRSGRLNVLLNLVRRIGGVSNVHVLLSARTFEFNHDVRLRAIEADSVTLALPPWHEVKTELVSVGIDPETWPEKARDVVRIPQALKTFIGFVRAGRKEPFTTYQAMLEQLWQDRIASANDSGSLIPLASDLAGQMAEEETLWLAAARFDDRLSSLRRLEALGFIVRSENQLSVAFSHQTVFDYVLARTFVRQAGLLSTYVLERQDSLFVRAKVWSALNYLREAEVGSYEHELRHIWSTKNLRRHLRLLLIEFLGQVTEPLDFEQMIIAKVLSSPGLRMFGLKAIGTSSAWFTHFASTAIRDAMSGTDAEVGQALRILAVNWNANGERVTQLIRERWLPHKDRDSYTWSAVQECPHWTNEVEEIAAAILKRSPISIWAVDYAASTLAVEQPEVAARLVRYKLDFLLAEAKSKDAPQPFPENGSEDEKLAWYIEHRRTKDFENLLEGMEWNQLPALAETAPAAFLHHLWHWYVSVFEAILACADYRGDEHIYPGQYILEIELTSSQARSEAREKPVVSALQIAVEELADKAPADFVKWADENSSLEILPVQQLIADGYGVPEKALATEALDWLLADKRRFQLGTRYGHRQTTIDLIRAVAPYWSASDVQRFEKSVLNYRPRVPDRFTKPDQRKLFADSVRATKKDLLQAIEQERLSSESRELVTTEERALGNRFDRSVGEVEGGFIGSPMEAAAMAKAKDRDILKILREIPDNTDWSHPTQWMRGGNIQLSRAFSEFAKNDPERAARLIEHFEPLQQERAAGYALDAMADEVSNNGRVVDALVDLHSRGFQTQEFRDSAARAIEKIANRGTKLGDQIVNVLAGWLDLGEAGSSDGADKESRELSSGLNDDDLRDGSILWGLNGGTVLPAGNFTILSALASILLNQAEPGRDRYLKILEEHLARERNPNVWRALLYRLNNAGGSTPQVVSVFLRKLFARFPAILETREAVVFLAYAQRWDAELVFDLIKDWPASERPLLQRAYGELVGLVATVSEKPQWVAAKNGIIVSGTDETKIGLAHAAVNMWSDNTFRPRSNLILVALLKNATKKLVAVVMDVFRVADDLPHDRATVELLHALANPSADVSAAPSHFVVERLQALLPHEAGLIATIAQKLVNAWRGELSDMRTRTAMAAPQLTDLAITLHRLGGASRQSGVAIFEAMIEIDAYGARETLAEIDGRFGPHQATARHRLTRRRPARGRRAG